jgi:hypothetical protein
VFRVGKLVGSLEQAPPASGVSKRMKSAASGLKQLIPPRTKLAVIIIATSLVAK